MMTHKILNRDPKDEILKAFRLFDDDETGRISFKTPVLQLGEVRSPENPQRPPSAADFQPEPSGFPLISIDFLGSALDFGQGT